MKGSTGPKTTCRTDCFAQPEPRPDAIAVADTHRASGSGIGWRGEAARRRNITCIPTIVTRIPSGSPNTWVNSIDIKAVIEFAFMLRNRNSEPVLFFT